MAAPTLTNLTTGNNGTSTSTSHSVTLTAGTANKWIILSFGAAPGTVAATGWTNAKQMAAAPYTTLLRRSSTTDTAVTVTTTNSARSAWVAGHTNGQLASSLFSTGVFGRGNGPDLDSVSFSTGDYRSVAVLGYQPSNRSVTTWPTLHTDNRTESGSGFGGPSPEVAIASRALTGVSTVDPSAHGISQPVDYAGFTWVIPESVSGAVTVTPAVIATTATLPSQTTTAAALVEPAELTTSAAFPAVTAAAASLVTPAVFDTTVAITTPTINTDETTQPAVISLAVTLSATTQRSGAVVEPDVIVAVVDIPQPLAAAVAVVTPSAVDTTVALPAASPLAESVVTPNALTATIALPAASALSGVVVTPAVLAALADLPAPVVGVAAVPTPGVIVTTATLPAATAVVTDSAEVLPAVIAALVDVPLTDEIQAGATVTPDVFATTVAFPGVTLFTGTIALYAKDLGVLYRNGDNTILTLAGAVTFGGASGYRSTEGWHVVSGIFAFNDDTAGRKKVMDGIRSTWLANQAASTATLTAALNTQLNDLGFRRSGGDLVGAVPTVT